MEKSSDYIQSWDIFAKPITLTYNGKPAFTTLFSGIYSIFVILIFCVFMTIQFLEVFEGSLETDSSTIAPILTN